MEQLLNTCAVLLGLVALMIAAQRFASWGAPRSLIDVRPFNCSLCLTFWTTNVLLFGALIIAGRTDVHDYLIALLFAFVNYFYIKTKIKIYE